MQAAIARLAPKHPQLAERLIEKLAQPNSISVIAAVSQALALGWPDHEIWNDLEARLRHSESLELRHIGIRRRIRSHRHDDNDKRELMWRASRAGPRFWNRSGSAVTAIIEVVKWPGDVKIRDEAIRYLNPRVHDEDGFEQMAATRIILDGYADDPVAIASLSELIRTEEHAFLSDSHGIWKAISEKYVGNPEMIAAADEWLDRWSEHRYPEISFAARLGWTAKAKQKLLQSLTAWVPFWAAEALLDGWGMEDAEVGRSLKALADSDKASQIGHLFPRIIADRKECFSRLIGMLESKDCLDPGRVLAGICDILEPTDRERVLQDALAWVERPQILGNRESVLRLLLARFADDSRVELVARREMKRRDGDWIEVLKAFGHVQEVLTDGLRMATPLPSELRSEIVEFLGTNASFDEEAYNLLALHDLESNSILKTEAAISYFKALRRTDQPRESAIANLSDALVSGGFDHESREQSAVCGLDILGRIDIVVSVRKRLTSRPCN